MSTSSTTTSRGSIPMNDDTTTMNRKKTTSNSNSSSSTKRGKKRRKKEPSTQQPQQPLVECKGRPKEALEVYRKRVYQFESEKRSKPDMQAFKELRDEWTLPRRHGELRDVPIGLHLRGRGEAAILGIHCAILKGIDGLKGEPCYAVCISGGYDDDEDCSSADGTIYYTGEGGRDKKKQHVEDQKETAGNVSLILSYQRGTTIRVLRGTSPNYYYLGLYRCTAYTYEPSGLHGKKVFKFELKPIMEHQCPKARALPLVAPKLGRRSHNKTSINRTVTTKKKNNKLRIRLAMPKNMVMAPIKKPEEGIAAQPKKLLEEQGMVHPKLLQEDSTTTEEPTLEIPQESLLPAVKKLKEEGIALKLEEEEDYSVEEDSIKEEPTVADIAMNFLQPPVVAAMPRIKQEEEEEEEEDSVVEERMAKIPRRSLLPSVSMAPVKQEEEDSTVEEPEEPMPHIPPAAMIGIKQEEEEDEEDSEPMPTIPRRSLPPVPDSVSSLFFQG